jgi:hypothetical protein
MPTPQSKDRDELLVTIPGVQAELAHWEQLVFSFDMDKEGENSHETGKGQGPGSTPPTPTSRPQSDTACGVSEQTHTTRSLLNITPRRRLRLPQSRHSRSCRTQVLTHWHKIPGGNSVISLITDRRSISLCKDITRCPTHQPLH